MCVCAFVGAYIFFLMIEFCLFLGACPHLYLLGCVCVYLCECVLYLCFLYVFAAVCIHCVYVSVSLWVYLCRCFCLCGCVCGCVYICVLDVFVYRRVVYYCLCACVMWVCLRVLVFY